VKPEKEKSNASTLSFVKRVVVADQIAPELSAARVH
jgi:hypothetical protein